jgi:hypothetical protein
MDNVSMNRTETDAAQPGDLITYRYTYRALGMNNSAWTTRKVEKVAKDGNDRVIGYSVDGGYFVPVERVGQVHPTYQEAGDESLWPATGPMHPDFPLEPGQ